MRGCKWKNIFKKTNMTGSVKATCRCIKTKISTLRCRISDKDTWRRTRCKFVQCVGSKPRIAETAEAVKFRVVRRDAKEFKIWGEIV